MNTNIESALTALIGNDPRFHRAMTMLQGKTPAEMQQLGQNQQAAQMCCCETNRNIDAVRTEGYRNTCSIVEAIKEDGEKTRAMFSAYQMAELKAKLEEKERQLMTANILNSQTAQTVDLVQRLRQLLFRHLSFRHLQVRLLLPLRLSNKLVVS